MTSQSGYRAVSWESLPCSGRLKCPRKHAKPLVLSKMDQSDVLVEKGTPSALSEGRAGTKRQHSRILRVSFPRLRGRTSKYPLGLRQISFSSIVVSILIFSFLLRLTTFCKFQWRGGGVSGGFKGRLSASNVPRRLADDGLGGGGLDGQCMRLLGSENEGTAGTGAGRGNNPRERLNDAGDDVWVRRADLQDVLSGSSGSRPSCEGEQQAELELRILPSGDGNENGDPREEGPASNLERESQQGTPSSTGNTQSTNDNDPYGVDPFSQEKAVNGAGSRGFDRPRQRDFPVPDLLSSVELLIQEQERDLTPKYYVGSGQPGEKLYSLYDVFFPDQDRSTQAIQQRHHRVRPSTRCYMLERLLLWQCIFTLIIWFIVGFAVVQFYGNILQMSTITNTTTFFNTTSTPTTNASNSTT